MDCKDSKLFVCPPKKYGVLNSFEEPFLAPECLVIMAKKKTQAGTQLSGRAALIFQTKGGKR